MATFNIDVNTGYLRTDGTHQVRIRVYHNSKHGYIDTPHYVTAKQLKKSKGKVTGDLSDKDLIEELNDTIKDYRKHLVKMGRRVHQYNAKELAAYLENRDTDQGQSINFIKFGWDYVAELRKVKRKGAADNFKTTLNALTDFFKRESVDITEITSGALRDFEAFLRTERTITRKDRKGNPIKTIQKPVTDTGAAFYQTYVRTLFNEAIDRYNDEDKGEIVIKHYPFRKYKVPRPARTKPRNVEVDVIRLIRDHPGGLHRVELARDVSMLSFYLIGMNTADMYDLPPDSYDGGRISYFRVKTRGTRKDQAFISIKVEPEAIPLIEKYRDPKGLRLFRFHQMYASPHEFITAVNKGLKQILPEDLPVKKRSFYIVRHTWSSTARNKCEIDTEIVHEALNHASERMRVTNIYIEKDWIHIDRANRKVIDYMKTINLELDYKNTKATPKSEPVDMKKLMRSGAKIHAIKAGTEWKNVVDQVNSGRAILSVRIDNEEVDQFTKLGWQALKIGKMGNSQTFFVDGKEVSPAIIAANEGLVVNDLYFWLGIWSGNFEGLEGGIIHFTEFRY